jgi:hypothetical protein
MEHPLAFLNGFDPLHNLVFHASWSDWEEGGWIAITECNGEYFYQEGGHCVMAADDPETWNPTPISQDDALALMLEWEKDED